MGWDGIFQGSISPEGIRKWEVLPIGWCRLRDVESKTHALLPSSLDMNSQKVGPQVLHLYNYISPMNPRDPTLDDSFTATSHTMKDQIITACHSSLDHEHRHEDHKS